MKNLLALLLSTPLFANQFSLFEGTYEQPSNGSQIDFWDVGEALSGNFEIPYTDQYGEKTGNKITYYFYYPKKLTAQKLTGILTTYDSYYGCRLENGETNLELIDSEHAKITFNQVIFTVQKIYQQKKVWHHYYQPDEIIYSHTPAAVDCIITSRLKTAAVLTKIK